MDAVLFKEATIEKDVARNLVCCQCSSGVMKLNFWGGGTRGKEIEIYDEPS